MHSSRINGAGELRGQPSNPGSPGKWPLKPQFVCKEDVTPSNLSLPLNSFSLLFARCHHNVVVEYTHLIYIWLLYHWKLRIDTNQTSVAYILLCLLCF